MNLNRVHHLIKTKLASLVRRRQARRLAVVVASFLGLATLFNNCGKEALVPLQANMQGVYGYATVEAHFCTSPPVYAQQAMKYLFILDHSASNQPNIPLVPGDVGNTDSSGARRYGPMINFAQNIPPVPNTTTSFDIVDFSTGATEVRGFNGFTSNVANFVANANADWIGNGTAAAPAPVDGGFTNYQLAMEEAYTLIKNDLQASSVLPGGALHTNWYVIVLVTDGAPIVANPGGPLPNYEQQYPLDLGTPISNLMNLKYDPVLGQYLSNISLNTAYYYNANAAPDASAVTLLEQIAAAGNGVFTQFGGGQQILYSQFSPPVRNMQNQLVDVYVENTNAVWWDNGVLMQDTDGDGFPDLMETQNSSNSQAYDSDGNGVSDLVEFRSKGVPCKGASCSAAGRDPYAICDGFNPQTNANGAVTFSSTANDGLNDCEKFILGGNRQTFNSSGSLIPDALAFKNTIAIQPNQPTTALVDPFGDGLTNYSKLKLGLPIQVSNRSLANFQTRITDLEVESQPTPSTTCYHLNVQNVAMTAPDNNIKLYVIQNSAAVQDKPFLMTATHQIGLNRNVIFQVGDFQ